MEDWAKFIRDNFDKLLLAAIFACCALLVIHVSHDGRDMDLILWARETTGTVLGALLGLITGHALAASAAASRIPSSPAPLLNVANQGAVTPGGPVPGSGASANPELSVSVETK